MMPFRSPLLLCGAMTLTLAARVGYAQSGPVLSDLDLWLNADQGITTNGSGVTAWSDQSGNGRNGTQSTINAMPQLIPNALHGHSAVRFNGFSDFLTLPGQIVHSQQYTIMAVVTDTHTDSGPHDVLSNWNFDNVTNPLFFGTINQNPDRAQFTEEFGPTDPNGSNSGVGHLQNPASAFLFTGVNGMNAAAIYQNSSLLASKGSAISPRNLGDQWYLGTLTQEFGMWQGDIAEVLVYDRALAPGELQTNWNYLNGKYNGAATPAPGSLPTVLLGSLPGILIVLGRRCEAGRKRAVQ